MGLPGPLQNKNTDDGRNFRIWWGAFRFGATLSQLIEWPKLARKVRIATEDMTMLEARGRNQGAKPQLWYGSIKSMPLDQCCDIQVMNEEGVWESIFDDD